MLRALLLILGPIAVGTGLYLADAPAQEPGVYVETPNGVYRLANYAEGPSGTGIEAHGARALPPGLIRVAPVPPGERVTKFFVLTATPQAPESRNISAELFFLVGRQTGGPFAADPVPLPVTVLQVSPQVFRIAPQELNPTEWRGRYAETLANYPGSRVSVEFMLGLVVTDAQAGTRRTYPVQLGPWGRSQ